MHDHHDHAHPHSHEHTHAHTHEHTHDGVTHTHEHTREHSHDHAHPHEHDQLHSANHDHQHSHDCSGSCEGCAGGCSHTPMEELLALMQYMVNHNGAHARELAALAEQLKKNGNTAAYEQVMVAVSDFETGNLRLSAVINSLK